MNDRWYLRKPDGTVYGPAALEALREWAADGRIAPDDHVSQDEIAWQPAPALAALEMEWVLQLANGDLLGPVHLLALRDAWQADLVPKRAAVVRRGTGQAHDLADTLVSALVLLDEQRRQRLAELAGRIEELEAARAAADAATAEAHAATDAARSELGVRQRQQDVLDARIRELESALAAATAAALAAPASPPPTSPDPTTASPPPPQWRELQAAKDVSEREALRWKRLYESDSELHQRQHQESEAALRTLRTDLLAAQRQVESLQNRLRSAEATPPQTVASAPVPGNLDAASLADMVRRLTRNYHAMTEQAERSGEELAQARARLAALESGQAGQDATAQLAAQAAELEATKAKLGELETTHRGILKEFRDLNDRHLRLVQSRNNGTT